MANAAAALNGTTDVAVMDKVKVPGDLAEIPTRSTREPVKIFRVTRKGKTFEIHAEDNVSWYCPAPHYLHLLRAGKAPLIGDRVAIEFYADGSVKNFEVVNRK